MQSAIANGENNKGMSGENLVVARVEVGKSIVMKRWRPRARGRMGKYRRVWSSLGIVLKQVAPGRAEGESKSPEAENPKVGIKAAKEAKTEKTLGIKAAKEGKTEKT